MRAPLGSPVLSFPSGLAAHLVLLGLVLVLTPIDLWRRVRAARLTRRPRHGN